MFHPRAPQSLTLLLGVPIFLVTASHSFPTQQATQQIINNDFSAAQLALSLVINQMAVLRILNESSTISSLRERELQEMQNMKLLLDVSTEELKNDLQDIKEEALNELQNMKAEALNEINMKNEEATQGLHDLKETALNASLQGTRRKTYIKYDNPATHSQALEACEQLCGRLALPTNEEEEEQITKVIGISFSDETWLELYWISGTDQQEEGKWIDSVTGEPLRYTNFEEGEPNDASGIEDCLNKSSLHPGWNDSVCNRKGAGYVCEFIDE